MPADTHALPRGRRLRAIRHTYANALLWAIGNGLVSSTLVIYLALELGAEGLAISWIVASPRLAGVARLGVPALIARLAESRWGGRKQVCLCGYAASSLVLLLVPVSALVAGRYGNAWGIALLVGAWCVYHLFEYVATVSLWSWVGDLYPLRLRSHLLGHRERWLVAGRVIGIGTSLSLTIIWRQSLSDAERWAPLAASASIGAGMMLLAILPLAFMPSLGNRPSASPEAPWRTLRRALAEWPYRKLIAYNCLFGIANGITGSAQAIYPWRVLGISYEGMVGLRSMMRTGQASLAPWAGDWIARWGARRVMLPAHLIVATGPLFYWLAAPAPPVWGPWVVGGAFVVWIVYVVLNVGLDTLKLDLADPRNNAPFLSVYYTMSDLSNAATLLFGGVLYDTLVSGTDRSLEVFAWLFLSGWVLRTLTAGMIPWLDERPPG